VTDLPERLATGVASHIDRRRFMRRTAQAAFFAAATIAAGGGLEAFNVPRALANPCNQSTNVPGPGCPNGGVVGMAPCGPSPCCSWYSKHDSSKCDCSAGAGKCKKKGSNSGYCEGDGLFYSSNCWSCSTTYHGQICVTTCCDCGINSKHKSTCGKGLKYYANRCISWDVVCKPVT
jgi:hypothetical protein